MLKNIIFDLGNVLVDCHFSRFFSHYNIAHTDQKFLAMTPIYENFNRGEITRSQFLEQLQKILETKKTFEEIAFDWADIFTLNAEMVGLAEELSHDYQIYIFSNTDEIHFSRIIAQFSELKIFQNNFILSYEIGALKPQTESYRLALEKFALAQEESLFIDDRIENVNGAKIFGMDAIQHLDVESTKQKLAKLLP